MLSFVVEGRMVPWQRTTGPRRRTPTEQRTYQRSVALHAQRAMPRGWPTDAHRYAVEVAIFVHPKQRLDADNGAKTILDALNKVAWGDDIRVGAIAITRAVDRERPRVEVTVVPYGKSDAVSVEIAITSERPRSVGALGARADLTTGDRHGPQ